MEIISKFSYILCYIISREDVIGEKFQNKPDDIQNHAINSTQDLDRKFQIRADSSTGKSRLKSRFKAKLKHLNLTTYDPILELEEIESDFREWSSQHLVLKLKSLSELVGDRNQLSREIFHIINKKEFKKLLPKRLKVLFIINLVVFLESMNPLCLGISQLIPKGGVENGLVGIGM